MPYSVWYPIDEGNYETSQYKMYMEGNALENLTWIMKGGMWIAMQPVSDDKASPWPLKHIMSIRTEAVLDAPIANDFSSGDQKLIPIVFSHGILANKEDYQIYCMEMASNGYIVLIHDHCCGTGRYVQKEKEVVPMNTSMPHPGEAFPKDQLPDAETNKATKFWYDLHLKRSQEVSEVIDDMQEDMFMSNRMHFGKA